MGLVPFQVWAIRLIRGVVTWVVVFILTIHKLFPLFFLIKLFITGTAVIIGGRIMLITARLIVNTHNFLVTLLFSSIVHTTWIMLAGIFNKRLILVYWRIYRGLSLGLVFVLIKANLNFLFIKQGFLAVSYWLVLSGFPPLIIFWLKAYIVRGLIIRISNLWRGVLILIRVLVLRAYFRTWHLRSVFSGSNLNLWGTVRLFSLPFIFY